jgi:hypothetical protein
MPLIHHPDNSMTYERPSIHLRYTLRGSKDKQSLFHAMVKQVDRDYPTPSEHNSLACVACGGVKYCNPFFTARDLRALARQINDSTEDNGHLKIKIHQWISMSECRDRHTKVS